MQPNIQISQCIQPSQPALVITHEDLLQTQHFFTQPLQEITSLTQGLNFASETLGPRQCQQDKWSSLGRCHLSKV